MPTKMLKTLFTTAAMDNIDHNPGSSTATDSFHGTSISLAQHHLTEDEGEVQILPEPTNTEQEKIPQLPFDYTNILPVSSDKSNQLTPKFEGPHSPSSCSLTEHCEAKQDCLKLVSTSLEADRTTNPEDISWAAYYASTTRHQDKPVTNIGLMPLLLENALSCCRQTRIGTCQKGY
jgi:hypothetical protein